MNIKEQCISSVFVHLIAVLLLAAVSQFHPKAPPALTVALYEDNPGLTTDASQTRTDAQIKTAKPAEAAEERAVETELPAEGSER